jgi:beta-aspartyl-peptidase (threonine type)
MAANETSAIVVHGGAGPEPPEEHAPRRAGVERAARAGHETLAGGGSALEAVLAAVVVLENDPFFNAGLGSVLTTCGHVEMDASVMEGSGLEAGAVGAVRGVANPILLAEAVRREGREVLLVGPASLELARRSGVRLVEEQALVTPAARRRWLANGPAAGETVGAVARDRRGHVAAATSTGGVPGKRAGRIGDSAVIGAGTYADDTLGAGSATGPGEKIIRATMVRMALERVAQGAAPDDAAALALEQLRARLDATAGLILVDPQGRVGTAFTTPAMASAWITPAGGLVVR